MGQEFESTLVGEDLRFFMRLQSSDGQTGAGRTTSLLAGDLSSLPHGYLCRAGQVSSCDGSWPFPRVSGPGKERR